MLGVSVYELLLVVLILIVPVFGTWFLLRSSRFRTWLMRKSEARHFQAQRDGEVAAAPRRRFVQFPVSLYWAAGSGVAVTLITWPARAAPAPRSILYTGYAIAIGFIVHGLWLHFQPNVSRRTKYERFLSGCAVSFVASFAVFFGSVFATAAALAWLATVQIVTSIFVRPWAAVPGTSPSTTVLRAHRVPRNVFVVLAVLIPSAFGWLLSPLLLIAYLTVRFAVGERLELAPILYLRSFRYPEGPTVLGRVVTKEAFRFGMLFAIVHARQKGSELMVSSAPTRQPIVETVEETKWQDYVISKLRICSAIIIDRSLQSEGLAWEIGKATALVPPSRIAILQKRGSPNTAVVGVWTLEYDLSRRGVKEARRALRRWFEQSRQSAEESAARRSQAQQLLVSVFLTSNSPSCLRASHDERPTSRVQDRCRPLRLGVTPTSP